MDEMEPKLRENTALETMRKGVIYTKHSDPETGPYAVARKGYIFNIYVDGQKWQLGVYNARPGKKRGDWIVTDLLTGLAISRNYCKHPTRKGAIHTLFNTFEFDSYAKIVRQALKREPGFWYFKQHEEFKELCRNQGYMIGELEVEQWLML